MERDFKNGPQGRARYPYRSDLPHIQTDLGTMGAVGKLKMEYVGHQGTLQVRTTGLRLWGMAVDSGGLPPAVRVHFVRALRMFSAHVGDLGGFPAVFARFRGHCADLACFALVFITRAALVLWRVSD